MDKLCWERLKTDTLAGWLRSETLVPIDLDPKRRLIWCAIGGSLLPADALVRMLGSNYYIDSWIPLASPESLEEFDLHIEDQVVFVSKSGATIELWSWLGRLLHNKSWNFLEKKPIVITETNGNPLHILAMEENWQVVPLSSNIGGRYSLFSPIGFMPLRWMGLDEIGFLNAGKKVIEEVDQQNGAWFHNIDTLSALWLSQYRDGISDWVLMPYNRRLRFIGGWWTQLVSESLGKKSPGGIPRGITAIRAVGPQDQHAQLQRWLDGPKNVGVIFLSLSDEKKNGLLCLQPENSPYPFLSTHTGDDILRAQIEGTQSSLQEAGVPTYHLEIEALNEAQLGALMMAWQIIVALVGLGLEINPFDQPAIEAGKRKTLDKLRLS
jgi:glucose-6-phosphate isomerase